MHLNVSSAKWQPFCLGLNVLSGCYQVAHHGTHTCWLWFALEEIIIFIGFMSLQIFLKVSIIDNRSIIFTSPSLNRTLVKPVNLKRWAKLEKSDFTSQGYPPLGNWCAKSCLFHFWRYHKIEMNMTNFGPFLPYMVMKMPRNFTFDLFQ